MRVLLKLFIFCWLAMCGFGAWMSLNVLTYMLLMSMNATRLFPVTWLMSVTSGLTLFIVAYRSLKFDVVEYVKCKALVRSK